MARQIPVAFYDGATGGGRIDVSVDIFAVQSVCTLAMVKPKWSFRVDAREVTGMEARGQHPRNSRWYFRRTLSEAQRNEVLEWIDAPEQDTGTHP